MSEWRRSAAIPYPRIWGEFPLFNPSTNKMATCVVMDITENYYETVINNIIGIVVANIPTIPQSVLLADQVSVAERTALWQRALKQRLSLMYVLKQSNGSEVIVGALINVRRSPFDPVHEFQGKSMKWSWLLEEYIYGKRPIYSDFNVAEVITHMAVYVLPEFNAASVMRAIFKCSGLLCQATGIKLFLVHLAMENIPSVAHDEATKAGFKEYVRVSFEELMSLDRTYYLPRCEYCSLMYNVYE